MQDKTILLIITGGIAAYKSLEMIRLLKKAGAKVRCILTEGGSHFVTPLSVSALSGEQCYTDLWSLTDEAEMGHIRLAREANLVVVAPASADFMAKMAHGLAPDLATTCLLATDAPIMVAPAMNPYMWDNVATQANVKTLRQRGVQILDPENGAMACGETGQGRMVEPEVIFNAITSHLGLDNGLDNGSFGAKATDQIQGDTPLSGKHAIVTSGPTYEPIDPVRFIGNRSSGKQGYAIACALRDAGANVTYITGPSALPLPQGTHGVEIETAAQMMDAVDNAMPADIFVGAAAVADYGVQASAQKQKKAANKKGLDIQWSDNPDILNTIARHKNRPQIVVGFAAETENTTDNARKKMKDKQCDIIVANQVGQGDNPVFGEDQTSVTIISKNGEEYSRNNLSKSAVATILTNKIIDQIFNNKKKDIAA